MYGFNPPGSRASIDISIAATALDRCVAISFWKCGSGERRASAPCLFESGQGTHAGAVKGWACTAFAFMSFSLTNHATPRARGHCWSSAFRRREPKIPPEGGTPTRSRATESACANCVRKSIQDQLFTGPDSRPPARPSEQTLRPKFWPWQPGRCAGGPAARSGTSEPETDGPGR